LVERKGAKFAKKFLEKVILRELLIQHSPDLCPQVAHRDISNLVQGRFIKIEIPHLPALPIFLILPLEVSDL
jgi:hypothetical protein